LNSELLPGSLPKTLNGTHVLGLSLLFQGRSTLPYVRQSPTTRSPLSRERVVFRQLFIQSRPSLLPSLLSTTYNMDALLITVHLVTPVTKRCSVIVCLLVWQAPMDSGRILLWCQGIGFQSTWALYVPCWVFPQVINDTVSRPQFYWWRIDFIA
jgi:hypothetical protein